MPSVDESADPIHNMCTCFTFSLGGLENLSYAHACSWSFLVASWFFKLHLAPKVACEETLSFHPLSCTCLRSGERAVHGGLVGLQAPPCAQSGQALHPRAAACGALSRHRPCQRMPELQPNGGQLCAHRQVCGAGASLSPFHLFSYGMLIKCCLWRSGHVSACLSFGRMAVSLAHIGKPVEPMHLHFFIP